jgi:methyltransferase (TIGR00027 family)
MLTRPPSRTALGAARHRALHQILEGGALFRDPLAIPILGTEFSALDACDDADRFRRALRSFVCIRSRLAEEAAEAAAASGTAQLVVLGAGLDTFAYRRPREPKMRVYEVDRHATQAWKREQLLAAAIAIPDTVCFVPVDFEHETLAAALRGSGFDPERRTFFTWLGVVPYLTEEAIFATLGYIASLPGGAEVIFDYANPPATVSGAAQAGLIALAARVAAAGEPLRTYFDTGELASRLAALGFRALRDWGPAEIAERFYPGRTAPARGGHVLHACTAAGFAGGRSA